MNHLEKLSQIYNSGQPMERLEGFGNARVYQLIDGRRLFVYNPKGSTLQGKNGWTQISLTTYAKSSREDLFLVIYEDTQECFELTHYLLEKVLLVVDWNYEKTTRTDFQRSKDHKGIKFRGKEGHVTIHASKSNLISYNLK